MAPPLPDGYPTLLERPPGEMRESSIWRPAHNGTTTSTRSRRIRHVHALGVSTALASITSGMEASVTS
jgi:hypothetical protein